MSCGAILYFKYPQRHIHGSLAVIAFRQMSFKQYTDALRRHYESFYGIAGNKLTWDKGPTNKLHPDFYILEFGPSKRHQMWTYATVGMSLDRNDDNLIELITYSKNQDKSRIELLTLNASFHRNSESLNLHHTVVVGQLTDTNTTCDHGFISLPFIEGQELEVFNFSGQEIHCYWLLYTIVIFAAIGAIWVLYFIGLPIIGLKTCIGFTVVIIGIKLYNDKYMGISAYGERKANLVIAEEYLEIRDVKISYSDLTDLVIYVDEYLGMRDFEYDRETNKLLFLSKEIIK